MALKGLGMLWLVFITFVSAQTIPELISGYPQLSKLTGYIDSIPGFAQQLSQADNFTFLAPTDDAFSTWAGKNQSEDDIKATLMYHLLQGTYPIVSLTSTPQFLPSSLTNASYSNVTGGQRVEAINKDGSPIFRSALNATSNVVSPDIIATGGIMHIIDKPLQVPVSSLITLAAANLSYIIGLSSKDDFLSVSNRPFINTLLSSSDLTYFVPNSAKALADFNVTGMTRDQVNEWALYLAVDRLVYSDEFVDGTELDTWATGGEKILVTVRDGDVWINDARVIGRDNLVSNGVFHVIDDLISPWNITRPPPPASSSTPTTTIIPESSIPTSTSKPISTSIPSSPSAPTSNPPSSHLTPAITTGISVGAVGLVLLATATIGMLIYRRKREVSSKSSDVEEWIWKPGELSSDTVHEMPQLETREMPVELSAGYYGQVRGKGWL